MSDRCKRMGGHVRFSTVSAYFWCVKVSSHHGWGKVLHRLCVHWGRFGGSPYANKA